MSTTNVPYTGKDIDFSVNNDGFIHHGKSIEITKRIDREELPQLGTSDLTYIKTTTRYEWNIEVDETTGALQDAGYWEAIADGETVHHIDITKNSSQLLTVSGAKCFDYREAHSAGGVSAITISGTASAILPS